MDGRDAEIGEELRRDWGGKGVWLLQRQQRGDPATHSPPGWSTFHAHFGRVVRLSGRSLSVSQGLWTEARVSGSPKPCREKVLGLNSTGVSLSRQHTVYSDCAYPVPLVCNFTLLACARPPCLETDTFDIANSL